MMRAEEQIIRLHENKAKISERWERAKNFIIAWHEFAGKPRPDGLFGLSVPVMHADVKPSNAARINNNPKKEIVATATLQIVRERAQPIPRPELHELLKSRGLEVYGAEPLVTLSTMLWRAGPRVGLLHLKGYGYWDGSQPYGPAGYVPGSLVVDDLDAKTIDAINAPDEE
jgi:hypothetical protein